MRPYHSKAWRRVLHRRGRIDGKREIQRQVSDMSIDAVVISCQRNTVDGTVNINLEARHKYGHAGQTRMEILNPPPLDCELASLLNLELWGGDSSLMLGDKTIAERIGYTQLRLVNGWHEIIVDFHRKRQQKQSKGENGD